MFYNPYYQTQQQMLPTQMLGTSQDERIWVQSQQAAENYLMAPNGFVRLWDSNTNRFYERRTDAAGRPYPMETYEYKKLTNSTCSSNELTCSLAELSKRVSILEGRIGNVSESNADDAAV